MAILPKRIVITGGPSSGKTSLINHLESQGFMCLEEVSRHVIIEARKEGIDQLFLTNPLLFSKKLLAHRLQQFDTAKSSKQSPIFYDRGMPDVTAYMDFINSEYSVDFEQPCHENRYDIVFLLPPWEAIYTQDSERYETFEQALKIHAALLNGYKKYNYKPIIVPEGNLEERTAFILKILSTSI
jgi:predicted ATPase